MGRKRKDYSKERGQSSYRKAGSSGASSICEASQRLLNDLHHDMAPLTALFSSHRLSRGR